MAEMMKWIADDKYVMRDEQQIGSFITAELALESVTAVNERERLRAALRQLCRAATFLLAMNATNYDRDAMRSEGGFDALQKAVDYAIEQSLNERKGGDV